MATILLSNFMQVQVHGGAAESKRRRQNQTVTAHGRSAHVAAAATAPREPAPVGTANGAAAGVGTAPREPAVVPIAAMPTPPAALKESGKQSIHVTAQTKSDKEINKDVETMQMAEVQPVMELNERAEMAKLGQLGISAGDVRERNQGKDSLQQPWAAALAAAEAAFARAAAAGEPEFAAKAAKKAAGAAEAEAGRNTERNFQNWKAAASAAGTTFKNMESAAMSKAATKWQEALEAEANARELRMAADALFAEAMQERANSIGITEATNAFLWRYQTQTPTYQGTESVPEGEAQSFAQTSCKIISIAAVALVGFCGGSAVIFSLLRFPHTTYDGLCDGGKAWPS